MAKLVVHGKEGVLREVSLGKQRVTIGRRDDNDLSLDDKATSSQHAVIITIGHNSYLQDLKSTNGTLINGKPVLKHTLRHGDVILIGRNHLSYVDEPESKTPAAPDAQNAKTGAIAAGKTGAHKTAVNPEATMKEEDAAVEVEEEGEYEPWAERIDKNAPPKTMVDSMLEAIRTHRESERTLRTQKKESIEQEWKKLIAAVKELKTRVGGHTQVKFFDVSRKQDEIMIRIQRAGDKSGQHAILICREHPHNPMPHQKIWLIETGNPDRQYDNCEDIMRNVLGTLAPLIA